MHTVFAKLPPIAEIAAALDLPDGTVRSWKVRDSIPARHDVALVALAAECGAKLTLAEIAAARAKAARRK